jgi:hypothetical protein
MAYTRSKAYKKNDSCYVEQKNWSVVRRTVGRGRYTTHAQVILLNEIYETVRLYAYYFQRVMVLTEKKRKRSRVTERDDNSKTPYRRVMGSEHVSQKAKDRLTTEYQTLNPAYPPCFARVGYDFEYTLSWADDPLLEYFLA